MIFRTLMMKSLKDVKKDVKLNIQNYPKILDNFFLLNR